MAAASLLPPSAAVEPPDGGEGDARQQREGDGHRCDAGRREEQGPGRAVAGRPADSDGLVDLEHTARLGNGEGQRRVGHRRMAVGVVNWNKVDPKLSLNNRTDLVELEDSKRCQI